MELQIIAIIIAGFSLVVSGITIWLTLLRKGSLKMTQPTMVFFGPDSPGGPQKIVIRTLLYSTARRGHIIENMFLRLRLGSTSKNFSFWAYGDKSWVRGSGLRVGYEGIAYYHHFLLHEKTWAFVSGNYIVEVFANLVNLPKPILLSTLQLSISNEYSAGLREQGAGVFFDWEPDSSQYHSRIDTRPDNGFLLSQE